MTLDRLCYERCAHSNYTKDPKDCPSCTSCRDMDEVGELICQLITNNMNRPLDFRTIVDHLDYSEDFIRSSIWYCQNRSLHITRDWFVKKNSNI
jgi:hypothetical protein